MFINYLLLFYVFSMRKSKVYCRVIGFVDNLMFFLIILNNEIWYVLVKLVERYCVLVMGIVVVFWVIMSRIKSVEVKLFCSSILLGFMFLLIKG